MSLAIQLVIAGLIFIAGAAGGIKWHAGQDAIKENERREQVERQRRFDEKRIDVAAAGHEADKREIQTKFVTITEEVERIVQVPFYAAGGQCLDDAGLRQLADAINPRAAASEPAGALPRPAASR